MVSEDCCCKESLGTRLFRFFLIFVTSVTIIMKVKRELGVKGESGMDGSFRVDLW